MNVPRRCVLVLVAGTMALGTAARAADPSGSWVGQSVIYTKPARQIRFMHSLDDRRLSFLFFGRLPITVRDEREGWLLIHDGHREGWVDKADFVLVRDAPAYFDHRVQGNPSDTWALLMRGNAWHGKGEPDNAIKDFSECIRLDPAAAVAFNNRGNAWLRKKEYDKAINDYNDAICLDPKYVLAFHNRGLTWSRRKEYDKAINDYLEAIRVDPQYVLAYNELAWVWATCPKEECRSGVKAVEYARKACELTAWKDPMYLDTLAAAYAENGQFDDAAQWQASALKSPQFVKRSGDQARQRLALYHEGKPYREAP
jgi:tetratricopeptide (TPR) repeat protein